MIRLASLLGLGKVAPLRWPAMGSEIVMEVGRSRIRGSAKSYLAYIQVWQSAGEDYFVRVIHEGTPVSTLAWVPLDDFIDLLESQIPPNIYNACMET